MLFKPQKFGMTSWPLTRPIATAVRKRRSGEHQHLKIASNEEHDLVAIETSYNVEKRDHHHTLLFSVREARRIADAITRCADRVEASQRTKREAATFARKHPPPDDDE